VLAFKNQNPNDIYNPPDVAPYESDGLWPERSH